MKSHTEYLFVETKKRREIDSCYRRSGADWWERSGVRDGLCFVSPMHITAAVYVNDLESGLIEDIGKWLEELAPSAAGLQAPPHRRGQWRCAPESTAAASPNDPATDRWTTSWTLGPWRRFLLCRVRRPALPQAVMLKVLEVEWRRTSALGASGSDRRCALFWIRGQPATRHPVESMALSTASPSMNSSSFTRTPAGQSRCRSTLWVTGLADCVADSGCEFQIHKRNPSASG